MNRYKKVLTTLAIVAFVSQRGFTMGHEIVNTDNFNLNIGGRIQEVGYGE